MPPVRDDSAGVCVLCRLRAEKCCSRCHGIWYCGATCQRIHWPTHKATCRKAPRPPKPWRAWCLTPNGPPGDGPCIGCGTPSTASTGRCKCGGAFCGTECMAAAASQHLAFCPTCNEEMVVCLVGAQAAAARAKAFVSFFQCMMERATTPFAAVVEGIRGSEFSVQFVTPEQECDLDPSVESVLAWSPRSDGESPDDGTEDYILIYTKQLSPAADMLLHSGWDHTFAYLAVLCLYLMPVPPCTIERASGEALAALLVVYRSLLQVPTEERCVCVSIRNDAEAPEKSSDTSPASSSSSSSSPSCCRPSYAPTYGRSFVVAGTGTPPSSASSTSASVSMTAELRRQLEMKTSAVFFVFLVDPRDHPDVEGPDTRDCSGVTAVMDAVWPRFTARRSNDATHAFLLIVTEQGTGFVAQSYSGHYTLRQWVQFDTPLAIPQALPPPSDPTYHRRVTPSSPYRKASLRADDLRSLATAVDSLAMADARDRARTYSDLTAVQWRSDELPEYFSIRIVRFDPRFVPYS
jgi:hypothetical protein